MLLKKNYFLYGVLIFNKKTYSTEYMNNSFELFKNKYSSIQNKSIINGILFFGILASIIYIIEVILSNLKKKNNKTAKVGKNSFTQIIKQEIIDKGGEAYFNIQKDFGYRVLEWNETDNPESNIKDEILEKNKDTIFLFCMDIYKFLKSTKKSYKGVDKYFFNKKQNKGFESPKNSIISLPMLIHNDKKINHNDYFMENHLNGIKKEIIMLFNFIIIGILNEGGKVCIILKNNEKLSELSDFYKTLEIFKIPKNDNLSKVKSYPHKYKAMLQDILIQYFTFFELINNEKNFEKERLLCHKTAVMNKFIRYYEDCMHNKKFQEIKLNSILKELTDSNNPY